MGHIRYDVDPVMGGEAYQLLYVSESSYDSKWYSILHSHAFAEIFYCVSGEGRFRVNDADFPVHADDLVIVNPHTEHTEYSLDRKHLEYIVLGVEGVEFTVPDSGAVTYRAMNYAQNRRELLPCFHEIVEEARRRRENYAKVCQHLLGVLLLRLRRHEQFDMELSTPAWVASNECVALKRYIDDHYGEDLTLDALAARTHLSRFYLSHVFQKEFGVSPISYLTQRRVREARALLTHTDHRLADISQMLGFSSQSYFCQCFQRLAGVSPRAYRKQSREKAPGGADKAPPDGSE